MYFITRNKKGFVNITSGICYYSKLEIESKSHYEAANPNSMREHVINQRNELKAVIKEAEMMLKEYENKLNEIDQSKLF